jgi:hypothetical protein
LDRQVSGISALKNSSHTVDSIGRLRNQVVVLAVGEEPRYTGINLLA